MHNVISISVNINHVIIVNNRNNWVSIIQHDTRKSVWTNRPINNKGIVIDRNKSAHLRHIGIIVNISVFNLVSESWNVRIHLVKTGYHNLIGYVVTFGINCLKSGVSINTTRTNRYSVISV